MIRNIFKDAFRSLTQNKATTLVNMAGLVLGITSCIVIYLVTSYELSFNKVHPEGDRIFRLVGKSQINPSQPWHPVGFVPNAVPEAIRDEIGGLGTVVAFHNISANIEVPVGKEKPLRFAENRAGEIIATEPAYFEVFPYKWLAGNPEQALRKPFEVVLTDLRAKLFFGDQPPAALLGRELVYLDSVRVTVVGIVQTPTGPTDLKFTDFISFPTIKASPLKRNIDLSAWNDIWSASQAYVKLPAGSRPEQFTGAFDKFGKEHYQGDFKFTPSFQPLSDLHFNEDYQDNYSRKAHLPTLYGLMVIAGFILLVAAVNFINLATAQAARRAKGVGIRKVLGGSRKMLLTQFLAETGIVTVLAVLIALLLTGPVIRLFEGFVPPGMTYKFLSGPTLLFLGCIAVLTTLLSGIYPSWILSGFNTTGISRGISLFEGNKGNSRKALLVFQFVVSLAFITGSIVVGRQIAFMRDRDLGFSSDGIISIRLPWNGRDKQAVLAEKIERMAGVEGLTREWFPPMGNSYMMTRFKYHEEGNKPIELDASAKLGDKNFIPLYGLRLLAGRNYIESDSLREVVINQTFSKALGFSSPMDAVGRQLEWQNGRKCPIVGVVADFHEQSFHEKIEPAFLGFEPSRAFNLGVRLSSRKGNTVDAALEEIRQAWQSVYPDEPWTYSFLDDSIRELYLKEKKTQQLTNAATGIAIFISAIGLLGLIAFLAEQRVKEIGIRKVLGATVGQVVWLLSRDFVKLICLGVVIASPIAWWAMQRWLQDFAYRISLSWWMFASAGLIVTTITLVTIGFQALRAARANPVKSLRTE
ncbi:ABC transporter permease [Ravibacter arvi]|uniref:ABC transporter permease n=1 Tax=Ravibacter arvi TaxID=2051041 RepID=A0ABP8MB98_9BACT